MTVNEQSPRPRLKSLRTTVDEWNEEYPVGTRVRYTSVKGVTKPINTKTRSEAQLLSGHTPVVWVEGIAGCVCLSHVDVIDTD